MGCARYDKMENTVRAYKRNKLKEDPAYKFKKLPGASGGPRPDVESKECLEGINVRAPAPVQGVGGGPLASPRVTVAVVAVCVCTCPHVPARVVRVAGR